MTRHWKLSIVCCVIFSATAVPGYGQSCKGIPATELVQMPTFCWEECSGKIYGPEYRIDGQLCPGSNHYCFALMHFIRGKKPTGDSKTRLTHLLFAKEQTRYTLNAIEKSPRCPIRAHVDSTWNEVNARLTGLGQK